MFTNKISSIEYHARLQEQFLSQEHA